MSRPNRFDVFHLGDRPPDQRNPDQRDRDRILYTSAFRRLAGVTQVVGSDEGHIFHNRLTHSLKVAQIARRLAEKLLKDELELADKLGGISPEIVEAAALAHDLGHPPFGHIAEEELDGLVTKAGISDGFEGNAQSFRIVAKLSIRNTDMPGLNLTRATLNAILKYPWLRQKEGFKNKKWSVYNTEKDEFLWARKLYPDDYRKSVEAELMDWADDITYAVHDLEDFYRAGLIPFERLINESKSSGFIKKWNEVLDFDSALTELEESNSEIARFFNATFDHWDQDGKEYSNKKEAVDLFLNLIGLFPFDSRYIGTRKQNATLSGFFSALISRYVNSISLNIPSNELEKRVMINETVLQEIALLKELTWFYVINNHSLAAQQHGQRKIIQELFEIFKEAASNKTYKIFPISTGEQLSELDKSWTGTEEGKNEQIIRIVVDLIAGMTEQQIVRIYHRLTGTSFGSVLDTIIV